MRKISNQTNGRTNGATSLFSGIKGLSGVLGGILMLALLQNPGQALGLTLPNPYSVDLAWDRSPSLDVTGYRVYYGDASGTYTNSVVIGNVATNTIPGLASGVHYFFAVSAFNASGMQSPLSNEISVVPGLPTVRLTMPANKQAVVTVKGLIGQKYDILATQTFASWTVIGTVVLGTSGSTNFIDTNAGSLPKRFYRTQQKP